jgi:ribose transport system permease protein
MDDKRSGRQGQTAVLDEVDQAAGGAVAPPSPDKGSGRIRFRLPTAATVSKLYLLGVLAGVMVIGTILSPFFLTQRNLMAVLVTGSVISVLAVGQFLVVVARGIDLSVGSIVALSSVMSALALRAHQPVLVAVVVAIAIAACVGLINGALVVYGGIAPFIVTLAMLSAARGMAYLAQQTRLIPISDATFLGIFAGKLGPIPSSVLIALMVMLVSATMMAFTPRGRRLYAVGANPEAARLSGLPVKRDVMLTYVTSACLAGLGGLMLAAQLTQGSAITGQGYELQSIAAAVVGGTSLFGGIGDPIRAVLGGLIIGTILNLMDILGVPNEAQLIVQGVVIVLAVLVTGGSGIRRITQALGRFSRRAPRAVV